jgi:hypothetical protein
MKGKYLRTIGGFIIATLMLAGTLFVSSATVEAQHRRRVIVVRPYPYRIYRPFGYRWGYPWGYPGYNSYYSHYIFNNAESASSQGYKDGFKTGRDDGKKDKSFNPERSHYYQESGFGNFAEVYRPAFSQGYQDGYREGLNQRG